MVLVASSGGHLAHLLWLAAWWRGMERLWVTFQTPDAVEALAGERVVWAPHPTNRNIKNLIRNGLLAMRTLTRWTPDVVVSTGAGVAVPWLAAGRAVGAGTVFLEVMDRVREPSWSARLVAPWVDEIVVPTEVSRARLGRGRVLGPIR